MLAQHSPEQFERGLGMTQRKPKTGDLFDRGSRYNYELVTLKAHRQHQYITILNGQLPAEIPGHMGLAIDYSRLTGGGFGFNCDIKQRRKIWKVVGT
jgi:hypothetical protein